MNVSILLLKISESHLQPLKLHIALENFKENL